LVFDPGGRLRVIDPAGRIRRFGIPTRSLGDFTTEGSSVLWEANGCLLVDDVSAPPAATPDPGPCLRSELALDPADGLAFHLRHRLPVGLRCVAAPRACRGTLRLTAEGPPSAGAPISRRMRFAIPAGQTRVLRVPLTCRGYRSVLRVLAGDPSATVRVRARTHAGERFPGELSFSVASGPADDSRRCGELPPASPTGLPATLDLSPLRGQALPGTPCRFARELQPGGSDGGARLVLECTVTRGVGRVGIVDVRGATTGQMIPEDTVRCETLHDRDPSVAPMHACDVWHRRVSLHARAYCAARCKQTRVRAAARLTLTRLIRHVAACKACTDPSDTP
jgi:hypothetical protein